MNQKFTMQLKDEVLENVILDKNNTVDYNDISITHNTRCAYPLNHLDNVLIPASIDSHLKILYY